MLSWLSFALLLQAPAAPIALHFRVYDGGTDVTAETRIRVFKAGDREHAVAEITGAADPSTGVAAGFYDAQAIRERDGRVVAIRWAEQLVVMAYPDEHGRHLEVINFQQGYGALEVRGQNGGAPDVALFPAGSHDREAAPRRVVGESALFVLPSGRYDLRITANGETTWHPGIEVPADRTRFWVAP